VDPDLSLTEALRITRETAPQRMPPEQISATERMIASLVAAGIGERAPKAGDEAPDFSLPNVRGEEIRLGDLLGRSAVVLAFYRGGW
jgi:hypothetical protein